MHIHVCVFSCLVHMETYALQPLLYCKKWNTFTTLVLKRNMDQGLQGLHNTYPKPEQSIDVPMMPLKAPHFSLNVVGARICMEMEDSQELTVILITMTAMCSYEAQNYACTIHSYDIMLPTVTLFLISAVDLPGLLHVTSSTYSLYCLTNITAW